MNIVVGWLVAVKMEVTIITQNLAAPKQFAHLQFEICEDSKKDKGYYEAGNGNRRRILCLLVSKI